MDKFLKDPSKSRIPVEEAQNKYDTAVVKLKGTQRIVVENHKDMNGLKKFALRTKWKGIVAIEDDDRNRGRLRGHLRWVAKKIDAEVKFIKF